MFQHEYNANSLPIFLILDHFYLLNAVKRATSCTLKGTVNLIRGSPGTWSAFVLMIWSHVWIGLLLNFFHKISSSFRINYKASPIRYFNDLPTSFIYICIGFCFECARTCLTSYTIFLLSFVWAIQIYKDSYRYFLYFSLWDFPG